MKRENVLMLLVVLTFAGMVGIYIAAWKAWQKYQASNIENNPIVKLFTGNTNSTN